MGRENRAAGGVEIPDACGRPRTTAGPAPARSSLASLSGAQPRPRALDPRPEATLTQVSDAARSCGHLSVPALPSWLPVLPSLARPRSHRPVEYMARVKSTQAPERSESAAPPASICPRVGSCTARPRPLTGPEPAPPEPRPCVGPLPPARRRPPEMDPKPRPHDVQPEPGPAPAARPRPWGPRPREARHPPPLTLCSPPASPEPHPQVSGA